jgi:hypothetical protein
MRVEKAYCVEAGRVLDIFEARNVYFNQASPRKRLTFECADDACREVLHPTVTGAMYDREVEEEGDIHRMYFKWGPNSEHLSTCFWLEQREAQMIVQEMRAQGRAPPAGSNRHIDFARLDAEEVPDLLFVNSDEHAADQEEARRRYEEIKRYPDRPRRIRAYVAQRLNQPVAAQGLQQVVEAFEAMTVDERQQARLRVSGIGTFSYAEFFRRAERPLFEVTRVFYGGASLESTPAGYRLVFYGEPVVNDAKAKVTWFISRRAIESDPSLSFLSGQLKKLEKGGARYARLFILGKTKLSSHMRGQNRVIDVEPVALKFVVAKLIPNP